MGCRIEFLQPLFVQKNSSFYRLGLVDWTTSWYNVISETIRRYGSLGLLPPTLYISNPMYEKKERPHAGIR